MPEPGLRQAERPPSTAVSHGIDWWGIPGDPGSLESPYVEPKRIRGLGKATVRMTAGVALAAYLDRFQRIELAGEPVWWTHRSDQHGLHCLPLRLGRA